jgi:hypothetical protein
MPSVVVRPVRSTYFTRLIVPFPRRGRTVRVPKLGGNRQQGSDEQCFAHIES